MELPKQTKRKLSESIPSGPPSYEDSYTEQLKPADSDLARVQIDSLDPVGKDSPSELALEHDILGEKKGDADLVLAAEALTRLNTLTPSPPSDESRTHSQYASPLSGTPTQGTPRPLHPIVQLVNTISKLLLVSNAVKYYETSKRNSATFNYAAGIVEKAAMPVFNKIELNLNSIHQNRLENRAKVKRRRKCIGPQDKKDIKKRIKFCLHILKLANDNISGKVAVLQDRMKDTSDELISDETLYEHRNILCSALSPQSTNSQSSAGSTLTPEKTQDTNSEIAATMKKIIHIISNFRPSSLSAEGQEAQELASNDGDVKLKSTIREIIFKLPAQVCQNSTSGSQKALATDRVIVFARESLDMIGRLTSVFNEQLEKAELWVDGPTTSESPRAESSPSGGDEFMKDSSQENSDTGARSPSYILSTEKRFHLN